MSEDNIILELPDINGNMIKFNILDIINYREKIYIVVIEADTLKGDVTVLRVEKSDNPDESIYEPEQDNNIIQQVYKIFRDKHKNQYKFEDN